MFVHKINQKLMDGFCLKRTDTSKSYGWIVMTFSANDLKGARNK